MTRAKPHHSRLAVGAGLAVLSVAALSCASGEGPNRAVGDEKEADAGLGLALYDAERELAFDSDQPGSDDLAQKGGDDGASDAYAPLDGSPTDDASEPILDDPLRNAPLRVSAGSGRMTTVATIYSRTAADGSNECRTDAPGYWDLANYGACDALGIPYCRNGARRVTLAMTDLPDGSVKYHTGCVRHGQQNTTRLVATIYSLERPGEPNQCGTARELSETTDAYWDLGSYGQCDQDGIPFCANGARRVTLGMTALADGGTKYHTGCVLTGQQRSDQLVATIYSVSHADGTDACHTAAEPEFAALGYWDLGDYSSCDAAGLPTCRRGAKRITLGMTRMPDGSTKYHTGCILTDQAAGGADRGDDLQPKPGGRRRRVPHGRRLRSAE
jgi:hypothetical protein